LQDKIFCPWFCLVILGLQSFPRECEDKDMAAMLDDITKKANEKSFVNILQHGSDDITNQRILTMCISFFR
jgi:hypothetical protein